MKQEQIFGIIRHALTFVGGILVIKGIGSEALMNEIIGGILSVVGVIWSFTSKK